MDGTPAQAEELGKRLMARFPYLQGVKSVWEVRLLRKTVGEKEALLDNPEFLNQHTDSHSTGLIDLTTGEVKDVRDWRSKSPQFLGDVLDAKLHYYFSKEHGKTSRAQRGLNPPIFSAIRFLTKAFQ